MRTRLTLAFNSTLLGTCAELGPRRPGLFEARLKGPHNVPLWALIGDLRATGGDLKLTTHEDDTPVEALEAAVEFSRQHQAVVDARIDANSASTWPISCSTTTSPGRLCCRSGYWAMMP